MTRSVWITVSVVLAAAAGIGAYYVVVRTDTPIPEQPRVEPAPAGAVLDTKPTPRPEHGDFNKRFEPKPPAPNRGAAG